MSMQTRKRTANMAGTPLSELVDQTIREATSSSSRTRKPSTTSPTSGLKAPPMFIKRVKREPAPAPAAGVKPPTLFGDWQWLQADATTKSVSSATSALAAALAVTSESSLVVPKEEKQYAASETSSDPFAPLPTPEWSMQEIWPPMECNAQQTHALMTTFIPRLSGRLTQCAYHSPQTVVAAVHSNVTQLASVRSAVAAKRSKTIRAWLEQHRLNNNVVVSSQTQQQVMTLQRLFPARRDEHLPLCAAPSTRTEDWHGWAQAALTMATFGAAIVAWPVQWTDSVVQVFHPPLDSEAHEQDRVLRRLRPFADAFDCPSAYWFRSSSTDIRDKQVFCSRTFEPLPLPKALRDWFPPSMKWRPVLTSRVQTFDIPDGGASAMSVAFVQRSSHVGGIPVSKLLTADLNHHTAWTPCSHCQSSYAPHPHFSAPDETKKQPILLPLLSGTIWHTHQPTILLVDPQHFQNTAAEHLLMDQKQPEMMCNMCTLYERWCDSSYERWRPMLYASL